MNIDFSMFEGLEVQGMAEIVITNVEITIENGKFISIESRGKYSKRKQFDEKFFL